MVHIAISPRILSIQSHVVSGYCGNKSATFPLQLLEYEVDVLNTVQLSNHTQYPLTRGQIFTSKDLEQIYDGLNSNKLVPLYDNILSGYIADPGFIDSLATIVVDIKAQRKQLGLDCWYSLDPVLGDDATSYYVPSGSVIADAYKKSLIMHADIITPNRFEASILSGIEILQESKDAFNQSMRAIDAIHKLGPKVVVLTSLQLKSISDNYLVCILSYNPRVSGTENGHLAEPQVWTIDIPKLGYPFTGTGDLFTALITGWLKKTNFDFKMSFENTVNSIHAILEETLQWSTQYDDKSVQAHELRLVQNRDYIIKPPQRFRAKKVAFESLS